MQSLLQATKFAGAASKSAGATVASRSTVVGFRHAGPVKQQAQNAGPSASLRAVAVASAVAEPPASVEAVPVRDEPETPRSINDARLQVKFVLPAAVSGAVVGRDGATAVAIKNKTGCYIQLTRQGTAVADARERMLIVAGEDAAALKQAVSMVFEAIVSERQSAKLCWLRRSPNRVFLQQVIPASCAGKVMGPEGEQIKAIGLRTGCSVVIEARPRNAAFVPFRVINYLADHPMQLVAAVSNVIDALVEDTKYRPGIQEISSVCMKILPISQRRVGNLLGPAGSHIRALQEVLKVKIGVSEAADASGVRHVTLYGPAQNVRVAEELVQLVAGTLPSPEDAAQAALAAAAVQSHVVPSPGSSVYGGGGGRGRRRGRSASQSSRRSSHGQQDDDAASVAGSYVGGVASTPASASAPSDASAELPLSVVVDLQGAVAAELLSAAAAATGGAQEAPQGRQTQELASVAE